MGTSSSEPIPVPTSSNSYALMGSNFSIPENVSDKYIVKKHNHPISTPFSAEWSIVHSSSIEPESRSETCYAYWPETDSLVIAYGVSPSQVYYNDAWILHFSDLSWNKFPFPLLSPRAGARAVLIKSLLYIFGGYYQLQYYSDLHVLNLETGECLPIATTGVAPEPCKTPVFAATEENLIVWGGFNNGTSIHVLNLATLEWREIVCDEIGRNSPSYALHNHNLYICGSSKVQGLIKIDINDYSVEPEICEGNEPHSTIEDSAMTSVGRYLFNMGGTDSYDHTFLYAYDTERKWWFIFFVEPDMYTVSYDDGFVMDVGYFLLPTDSSFAFIYRPKDRSLISCLGSKTKYSPIPISVLHIGPALSILNLRNDMFAMLDFE